MIDILLLAGVALCVLSVVMAIISVARTRAPRGAAIALVLGMALVFASAWMDERPFGLASLGESWQRLVQGQITLGTDPVTAPAPDAVSEPVSEPAPAAEPATQPDAEPTAEAEAPAAPAQPEPAETAPAAAEPAQTEPAEAQPAQ